MRRSDIALMSDDKPVSVQSPKGEQITGLIQDMNITSCQILSNGQIWVIPWASLRMYSYGTLKETNKKNKAFNAYDSSDANGDNLFNLRRDLHKD